MVLKSLFSTQCTKTWYVCVRGGLKIKCYKIHLLKYCCHFWAYYYSFGKSNMFWGAQRCIQRKFYFEISRKRQGVTNFLSIGIKKTGQDVNLTWKWIQSWKQRWPRLSPCLPVCIRLRSGFSYIHSFRF